MTDISTTSWSELDSGNNQTPPEGWPAGMFPNAVEPSARMNMGAVKRFWNRINPVQAATLSTTDSYVVTPTQAITGYGLYEMWLVRMPLANASTSPTLTISSLPPQPLRKLVASSVTTLASGDIRAKDHAVYWDGTQFILRDPIFGGFGVTSIVASTNTGVTASASVGPVVVKLDPTTIPNKAAPTSSDSMVISDGANSNVPMTALLSSLTAILNTFVGDSGSGGVKGLVPAPASGDAAAVKYLKADGTFTNTHTVTPGSTLTQNPIAATTVTQAHGLGAEPTFYKVTLQCLSTEGGYLAGQRIPLPEWMADNTGSVAFNIFADATTVNVNVRATALQFANKNDHTNFTITASKWELFVIPYLVN